MSTKTIEKELTSLKQEVASLRFLVESVVLKKGKITFTPKTVFDREIAKSMADYQAGRFYGPFNNHKDFIASLHKEAKKLKSKQA